MEHSDEGNREVDDDAVLERSNTSDFESRGAVNSLILDYYKKFGRKRDLEQFFSLSTAQGDIRDTSGSFWMKMKSENDSSDGERKSDSSHEVCRISIRCSMPESSSQEDEPKTKSDSPRTTSPPIIIEELGADDTRHSDDDFNKSDDNNSQKSLDALLDLSSHKPLSPTSSVTSQRKLEWDSLADVGYGNETDRKTSASSLSTLERLALKQHCSNNESKDLGPPASQSTPNDDKDKQKPKKGIGKKTKIYQKDIDIVEVNVPKSESNPQSINVNLTKHISFNVEKDGGINIDTVKNEVNVSPEKVFEEKAVSHPGMDKESQTSLIKPNTSKAPIENLIPVFPQKNPVMISLNTLRKRLRKKRSRVLKRKVRNQKKVDPTGPPEKSGEQLSAAESFEYLPGHIYNQNQINQPKTGNSTGNKSSLESSAANTTDSSKGSKHSLTKDLDKCIDVLKTTLQKRGNDTDLKNKLIKEIVLRLLNSKYRDDDSPTDFLSGLSFNTDKIGLRNNTTSSTSDANNTDDSHRKTPRKSILRVDKFNPNVVSSTSQSVPNLLAAASNEKFTTNLTKIRNSNTGSDSSRGKTSSDNVPKTSSEELYLKYLDALRREESYKRHLRDKETFLKQKLVSTDTVVKVPVNRQPNVNRRLNELIKDLTRNNYDDGSGDASKLEGSLSNADNSRLNGRNQRSHSVFTLSSSNSERQKRPNLKKMHCDRDCDEPSTSRHYCCCPQHFAPTAKVDYTDSSVQVNFRCFEELESNSKSKTNILRQNCMECRYSKNSPRDSEKCCFKSKSSSVESDRAYKSAKKDHGAQDCQSNVSCIGVQFCSDREIQTIQGPHSLAAETCSSAQTSNCRRTSKSSQADHLIQIMTEGVYQGNPVVPLSGCRATTKCGIDFKIKNDVFINEATRCLQTEISINPRIREPTLSDISIVADCDCARLISEQTRLVDPSDTSITKTYSNACTSSMAGKLLVPSEDNVFDNKTYDVNEGTNEQISKSFTDDYTIPIKGTDMSLQVRLGRAKNDVNRDLVTRSLGANDKKNILRVNDRVDQETSDENNVYEKVYPFSLPNLDNINAKPTPRYSSDRNGNKITKDTTRNTKRNLSPVSLVQTHRKLNSPTLKSPESQSPRQKTQDKNPVAKYLRSKSPENTRNTYPKMVTVKEKPQYRRANTDSEVMTTKSDLKENNNDYTKSDETYSPPESQRKAVKSVSTETQSSFLEEEVVKVKPEIKNKVSREANTDSVFKSPKETKCTGSNTEPVEKKPPEKLIERASDDNPIQKGAYKSVGSNTESNLMPPNNVLEPVNEPKQVEKPPPTATTSKSVATDPIVPSDIPKPSEITTDSNSDTKNSSNSGAKLNKKGQSIEKYPKDPIINMIQDITRRYSKNEIVKVKKKKCFKEIITVLSYLLETDDSTDYDPKTGNNSAEATSTENIEKSKSDKEFTDKGVQLSFKSERSSKMVTESSDIPISTDLPTSSDSAACKVLSKIKKECEKYHQKRCKGGRKCERSSSTSINCEGCRKVHYCPCKSHKCKRKACIDKIQKRCVAYNLIIKNSEAVLSEDNVCEKKPLKNVFVNLPRKDIRKEISTKQTVYRVENNDKSPRCSRNRSRSCPNETEVSSVDEMFRTQYCTVREYLEKNRPDFVEKCSQRQHCLKFINECRATERASQRKLVSMHVEQQPDLTALTSTELRQLAQKIGLDLRRKKTAPKFISEREMKKHSEEIYKTLPEVVSKKEEKRKENIKRTNLLMANIFKKNLQKKTLGGTVNISNYSPVIKI